MITFVGQVCCFPGTKYHADYVCYEPKYGPYSTAVLMYIALNTSKYPNFATYCNEN